MSRRFFAVLLLFLALLAGQVGGFVHAAQHLHGGDPGHPPEVCELCAAYAPLDAGAAPAKAPAPVLAAALPPIAGVPAAVGRAVLPPYASRAPPRLV